MQVVEIQYSLKEQLRKVTMEYQYNLKDQLRKVTMEYRYRGVP